MAEPGVAAKKEMHLKEGNPGIKTKLDVIQCG